MVDDAVRGEIVEFDEGTEVVPAHEVDDRTLWDQLPAKAQRLLREAPDFDVRELSDNTVAAYRRRISSYIVSANVLGFDPTPITPAKVKFHIKRLWTITDAEGRPVAPSTVYMGVSALKWLITHMRRGITDPDELARIPTLGDDLKETCLNYKVRFGKSWSEKKADGVERADFLAMLDILDRSTVQGCRNAAICHMLTASGCRPSEAASLDIGMVEDLERGALLVKFPKRKNDRGQDRHESVIKPNPYDVEHCPVRAIKAWVRMLGASGHVSGPLFVKLQADHSMPMVFERPTRQAVHYVFQRLARRVGVRGRITGHSGRVTSINWHTDANVDVLLTARHVGHRSVESTAGYVRKRTYRKAAMLTDLYRQEAEQ